MGTGHTWPPQRVDQGVSTLFFLGRGGPKEEPTWAPSSAPCGQAHPRKTLASARLHETSRQGVHLLLVSIPGPVHSSPWDARPQSRELGPDTPTHCVQTWPHWAETRSGTRGAGLHF